jgi:hypothetical protein
MFLLFIRESGDQKFKQSGMNRLNRVLGAGLVEDWMDAGSITDDMNPWYRMDLSTYDTMEKRKEIVSTEYKQVGLRRTGSLMVMVHPNYTLAFLEHEADRVECDMATRIQKRWRGILARNNLWSPYTDIGKRRLMREFESLGPIKSAV